MLKTTLPAARDASISRLSARTFADGSVNWTSYTITAGSPADTCSSAAANRLRENGQRLPNSSNVLSSIAHDEEPVRHRLLAAQHEARVDGAELEPVEQPGGLDHARHRRGDDRHADQHADAQRAGHVAGGDGQAEQHEQVEALVHGEHQHAWRGLRALDPAHVGAEQAPVVLHEVGEEDAGGERGGAGRAELAREPDEGGREGERVGRGVRDERAPAQRVAPEAGALVRRLPVRLEQEVADGVAHDQHREDLDPAPRLSDRAGRRTAPPACTTNEPGAPAAGDGGGVPGTSGAGADSSGGAGGGGSVKSSTSTVPRTTRVTVPSQRSSVSHLVPRTVAAE